MILYWTDQSTDSTEHQQIKARHAFNVWCNSNSNSVKKKKKAFCNFCIPLLLSFLAYEEVEDGGNIINKQIIKHHHNNQTNQEDLKINSFLYVLIQHSVLLLKNAWQINN